MTHSIQATPKHRIAARSRDIIAQINALGGYLPHDVVAVAARVFPAIVFWQSARTKVDGFSIKDSTYFLFEHVYALPLIPPTRAAVLATVAEHILPILLILGVFARFSALGLLIMTAVIQVFVFPDAWITHGLWVAALLVVVAQGPGRLSLDHLLGLDVDKSKR
ncbi:DoxX family protein [Roseinatronobacter sp. NSM]|uniref:DoxX family protein n=1 Tax=Roseinatronobacter sp. NSM TaxID=3457785 RepID=UPI0040370D67